MRDATSSCLLYCCNWRRRHHHIEQLLDNVSSNAANSSAHSAPHRINLQIRHMISGEHIDPKKKMKSGSKRHVQVQVCPLGRWMCGCIYLKCSCKATDARMLVEVHEFGQLQANDFSYCDAVIPFHILRLNFLFLVDIADFRIFFISIFFCILKFNFNSSLCNISHRILMACMDINH